MADVFISYSTQEAQWACELRDLLTRMGREVWMAPESIPVGSDYAYEIPNAIESCTAFLLVLSKSAQNSNWVPKELDLAITYNKSVIPFQIDGEMLTKSERSWRRAHRHEWKTQHTDSVCSLP